MLVIALISSYNKNMAKPIYTNHRQYHKKTHIRIYNIYRGMKCRCYCKNDYHYKWYGAKGVKVCKEWLDDFLKFYNWALSSGYNDALTIDRIDVTGDYEPNNCRWITIKEQCNNRHNSRYITIGQETKTVAQWLEFYKERNISKAVVQRRLKKGVSPEHLFDEPKKRMTHSKIAQYDLEGNLIEVFESGYDIKRKKGFCQNPIYSVCQGKPYCHTAFGFVWKYVKD